MILMNKHLNDCVLTLKVWGFFFLNDLLHSDKCFSTGWRWAGLPYHGEDQFRKCWYHEGHKHNEWRRTDDDWTQQYYVRIGLGDHGNKQWWRWRRRRDHEKYVVNLLSFSFKMWYVFSYCMRTLYHQGLLSSALKTEWEGVFMSKHFL